MQARQAERPVRPLRDSLEEYGRGIAGGLLFSLPLLYTMEVWWRGFTADPKTLLLYLALTYVVLLGYNRYSGVHHSATWREVMIESVEEMGLGLLIAAGILYLLDRIAVGMSFGEVLGKIVVEAMTVAVGVSVGTAQLGTQKAAADPPSAAQESVKSRDQTNRSLRSTWGRLVLAFCGAILIASNVAPTEEIVKIGTESPPAKLLGLMGLSLAMCALIFNCSGFLGTEQHVCRGTHFIAIYGVISSYAAALVVSALLLWFFGRFEDTSLGIMVRQTVVLAFPASLGASAGRLLIA